MAVRYSSWPPWPWSIPRLPCRAHYAISLRTIIGCRFAGVPRRRTRVPRAPVSENIRERLAEKPWAPADLGAGAPAPRHRSGWRGCRRRSRVRRRCAPPSSGGGPEPGAAPAAGGSSAVHPHRPSRCNEPVSVSGMIACRPFLSIFLDFQSDAVCYGQADTKMRLSHPARIGRLCPGRPCGLGSGLRARSKDEHERVCRHRCRSRPTCLL